MNLSENQEIVNALKQILEYYDYLEYDENLSVGTNQLCLKVSHPDANCHLGIIEKICEQLGTKYTCEPNKPKRFYIRIMNHSDYARRQVSSYQNEVFVKEFDEPEPDSAIAYYYRGSMKCLLNQYEAGMADYKKALNLDPNLAAVLNILLPMQQFASVQFNLMVKEQDIRLNRERFYREYHSKFLEREAKRAEVRECHGTFEWQAKREAILERDGELCVCGDQATEVHHKTHTRLGQELLSDLVALCRYCYRGIHSGEKIKLWHGSNPMNNKEYNKYLESTNWKEKRKSILERDGNLCICGEQAIYVHHKTYENLGQELDSDLVALCKNCHDGYHGRLSAKSESFWHMR